MSRFYGSLQGSRGAATRQGHASSGISGHIRGWDAGVRVYGRAVGENDVFQVFMTTGSNMRRSETLIGVVRSGEYGPIFEAAGSLLGPARRLEYLRGELRAERISLAELIELQGLAEHIDPDDVELLEAAGVPEATE